LIVIHLPIFIDCPLPEMMDVDGKEAFFLCPFEDAMGKRAFQEFGEDGEDVDFHAAKIGEDQEGCRKDIG
jgi:hypothetical protein